MKRQFKAGAQAKREVKELQRDLRVTHNFLLEKIENNHSLRNHNIELKADVMKLEKKCEQLEEQKKYFAAELKEFRINESKAVGTMLRQTQLMHEQQQLNDDLKFAYDRMKHNRDALAGIGLAYIVVKILFWIW